MIGVQHRSLIVSNNLGNNLTDSSNILIDYISGKGTRFGNVSVLLTRILCVLIWVVKIYFKTLKTLELRLKVPCLICKSANQWTGFYMIGT